jgi:branched-chain amino acid transport system substrate-binding protein
VVEALRKLKPDATADDLRSYLVDLQGFAGVNGLYDFKAAPNRGLGEANVVVTRWDANVGGWTAVSQPGGNPLN